MSFDEERGCDYIAHIADVEVGWLTRRISASHDHGYRVRYGSKVAARTKVRKLKGTRVHILSGMAETPSL